jgi:hypothetical protein
MAQTVSRRPLKVKAWVWAPATSCEFGMEEVALGQAYMKFHCETVGHMAWNEVWDSCVEYVSKSIQQMLTHDKN